MIEVRNVKLPLSGGKAQGEPYNGKKLKQEVARLLHIEGQDVASCEVIRRAVDAREKSNVCFVATVCLSLTGSSPDDVRKKEESLVQKLKSPNIVIHEPLCYEPKRFPQGISPHIVVVGAGAAGLFCALALAEGGAQVTLIERGHDVLRRQQEVTAFNETGLLNPQCNIQFGAGGAGTFSDGKLTTGTRAAAHGWILDAFVQAGAATEIIWQAKPHIGSDVLPTVIDNLVKRIEHAHGKVFWDTALIDLVIDRKKVLGVEVEHFERTQSTAKKSEIIHCDAVVLASGHSARDVFEMLHKRQVSLEQKPFSVGVRIEHPQALIDKAQYGKAAGHPSLAPADYKLNIHNDDGKGVYTFCMCPGGTVVAAASEPCGVVTNGMSVFARDGSNANAALLVNVDIDDFYEYTKQDHLFSGIVYQRLLEQKAFEAGGGEYRAPAQLVGDFLNGQASHGEGSVQSTYPRGVTWCNLNEILPSPVSEGIKRGIRQFSRKLRGFDLADAVLTGVETRSSSPLRIIRDAHTFESISTSGLYPCGEGAGYAGGIMSAAADGLKCADALIEQFLI
ncbi:MAG: FAD-dependent oxidoreductase [Coriobacteriales bacterium]|nr:FAD-dependent oxidoreductase [Coriobacteriales bacterium]